MTVFPKSILTILTLTILTTILKDILKWQHIFPQTCVIFENFL